MDEKKVSCGIKTELNRIYRRSRTTMGSLSPEDRHTNAIEIYEKFKRAGDTLGVGVGKMYDDPKRQTIIFWVWEEGKNARVAFNKLINRVIGRKIKLRWKKRSGKWVSVGATVDDLYLTKGVNILCIWFMGAFHRPDEKDGGNVFLQYS
jgi:hypothetical protein